ncbi:MAG: MTAP family purine nucleoside phosphorylase [Magnetococcales bacterium]|nr:MTAP family purine nucleoside phosphorylase [Magnetococcales bacterium]
MFGPGKRAVMVGTSLRQAEFLRTSRRFVVSTPHGNVELLEWRGHILLQRHGLDAYCPPHRINHHAHLSALHAIGIGHIIALGSVGSLHLRNPPGTVVVPDDFFAPTIHPTFFPDARGHRLPRFDPALRSTLLQCLHRPPVLPTPIDGGTYWQTPGPRFETPAEIRFHAQHVDLVGMTLASECILAGELDLPYAAVGIVDNYANGIGPQPLTLARFHQQVADNSGLARNILEALLEGP